MQIRSKTVMSLRARKRKQRAFCVPFILSEGNSFIIYVLSQCIMYCMHFQNIRAIKKDYFIHFFLLVFKIVENFQCIFNFDHVLEQWLTWEKEMKSEIRFFEHLENDISFLHEIKSIFHNFWTAVTWLKKEK